MWWRLTRTAWRQMPKAERKARFRKVVTNGPPVGLLAFRGDEPVGWVQVAPRRATPTFNTSPVAAPVDPQDDLDRVWAITCFYIAASGRRSGVAQRARRGGGRACLRAWRRRDRSLSEGAGRARRRRPVHGDAVGVPPPRVPRGRAAHAGAAADAARAAAPAAPARRGEGCSSSSQKSSASSRVPSNILISLGLLGVVLMATRFARAGRRLAVTSVILLALVRPLAARQCDHPAAGAALPALGRLARRADRHHRARRRARHRRIAGARRGRAQRGGRAHDRDRRARAALSRYAHRVHRRIGTDHL